METIFKFLLAMMHLYHFTMGDVLVLTATPPAVYTSATPTLTLRCALMSSPPVQATPGPGTSIVQAPDIAHLFSLSVKRGGVELAAVSRFDAQAEAYNLAPDVAVNGSIASQQAGERSYLTLSVPHPGAAWAAADYWCLVFGLDASGEPATSFTSFVSTETSMADFITKRSAVGKRPANDVFIVSQQTKMSLMQTMIDDQRHLITSLQKNIAQLNSTLSHVISVQNTKVAFTAFNTTSLFRLPAGATLMFNSVALNEGGAYDPATGTFTAPNAGIYQMSVHAVCWSGFDEKGVFLRLDCAGSSVLYMHTHCKASGTDIPATNAAAVRLARGAQCRVRGARLDSGFSTWLWRYDGATTTSFSGSLIALD